MLQQVLKLLPSLLNSSGNVARTTIPAVVRGFRSVVDQEIDFSNRENLKWYTGVREHMSKQPVSKVKLLVDLRKLLESLQQLPESSDYRKALEATTMYRIKVCEQNESDPAVEEVLDAHIEELVQECKEEMLLINLIKDHAPWDVPEDYTVPVIDYHNAEEFLKAKK